MQTYAKVATHTVELSSQLHKEVEKLKKEVEELKKQTFPKINSEVTALEIKQARNTKNIAKNRDTILDMKTSVAQLLEGINQLANEDDVEADVAEKTRRGEDAEKANDEESDGEMATDDEGWKEQKIRKGGKVKPSLTLP